MILDQLIVAFKAEGADNLIKTIEKVSRKVEESIKNVADAEIEFSKKQYLENLKYHKLNGKKELQDNLKNLNYFDIQKRKKSIEYFKWRERELKKQDVAEEKREKNRLKNIKIRQKEEEKAIKKSILMSNLKLASTAAVIWGSGKALFRTLGFVDEGAINATQRVASYVGTGISGTGVEGLEQSLGRWGGQMGEGVSTLRRITAQLGAMKYGDTSLVETLGKYGVSGIGVQSNSIDVLKAIMNRVQQMGVNTSEAFALMSEMGLSNAMMKIMQGGDYSALEKEGIALSVEERILDTNEKSFKSSQELLKAQGTISSKLNFLRDIRNLLVNQFPEAASLANLSYNAVGNVGGLVATTAGLKGAEYVGGKVVGGKMAKKTAYGLFGKRGLKMLSKFGAKQAFKIGVGSALAGSGVGTAVGAAMLADTLVDLFGAYNYLTGENEASSITNNNKSSVINNNQTYNNTTNNTTNNESNVYSEPIGTGANRQVLMTVF